MSATDFFPVDHDVLDAVSNGWYHAPHDVLGPHPYNGAITVRTIRRLADEVFIETKDGRTPAVHEHNGVWRAVLETSDIPDYRIVAVYGGIEDTADHPYRFLPTVGEMDTYLFSEGRHERLWDLLGAHVRSFDGELGKVVGTSFTVWAPNAKAVRVVGDFNGWDGTAFAMRSMGESGIWEIFIPEAYEGARYKYEIQYEDLSWHLKADPMARRSEIPPSTASIVTDNHFEWGDEEWLAKRAATENHCAPISIYEMHLGSWRPGLDYRSAAEQLIGHLKYCGFTHVEFMPLTEHPFTPSWGYQVTGYYSPTARFGTPDDLRYLINELHKAGIGVIMDWVPAHFPKDEWALARFDGTPLYEDPNPLRAEHPDWGTYVFNYGRREVRNFLVANALYWCEEFHIDGIRVDAVASMLYLDYSRSDGQWQPNVYGGRENLEAISFIQEVTATTYRQNPGIIMVAEESTSWPGVTARTDNDGLGFGLKWNMGWMNDTLRYMEEKPINRKWHHNEITFSLVYAFSEQFLLPLSHDEVVHGKGSLYQKMPGDAWQKLAGVRELFAYQWSHPGKKLLFMGQEFAQIEEWNESRGLDWWLTDDPAHDGVLSLVKRLNEVYREHPALWEEDFSPAGFEWIVADDADSNVIAYLRKSSDGSDVVAVVCNFSGIPRIDYRLGLPFAGRWNEVVNTDALEYGGSGVGNLGAVRTDDVPWNDRPYSAQVQLPPFGVLYLVPGADDDEPNAPVDTVADVEVAETADVVVANAPIPPVATVVSAAPETSEAEEVETADVVVANAPIPPVATVKPADEGAGSAEQSAEPAAGADEPADNPWLGMPGVLPFEDPDREPLGDYTIVEYDYTDTASVNAPDSEAPDSEPDYSANADGVYLQARDWLPAEDFAARTNEVDENKATKSDELDEDTQSLMEAAQNAADEFLSVPPAVESLDGRETLADTSVEQEMPEVGEEKEGVLIGTVLTTLINGASILPMRDVPPPQV
ncbi:MAG: 1,4-alpha-glucan branching protein GlgB [Actinomycetaceae bacterium]|nr:1,4-alpha-glucan branching protein GlgB [Actinomycetaceae bacterium]